MTRGGNLFVKGVLFFYTIFVVSSIEAGDINPLHPQVPKALGEKCIRDTEFMKKNHMDFLFERRDLVVIDGIRSEKESFNMCLTCHAVKNSDRIAIPYQNPKHFCRTCHDFAAVKIDCFECHLSVPDQTIIGENTK